MVPYLFVCAAWHTRACVSRRPRPTEHVVLPAEHEVQRARGVGTTGGGIIENVAIAMPPRYSCSCTRLNLLYYTTPVFCLPRPLSACPSARAPLYGYWKDVVKRSLHHSVLHWRTVNIGVNIGDTLNPARTTAPAK